MKITIIILLTLINPFKSLGQEVKLPFIIPEHLKEVTTITMGNNKFDVIGNENEAAFIAGYQKKDNIKLCVVNIVAPFQNYTKKGNKVIYVSNNGNSWESKILEDNSLLTSFSLKRIKEIARDGISEIKYYTEQNVCRLTIGKQESLLISQCMVYLWGRLISEGAITYSSEKEKNEDRLEKIKLNLAIYKQLNNSTN